MTLPVFSQSHYSLDFTDTGWKNDGNAQPSEFQSNGAGAGNYAGWNDTHSIADVGGSGIGATMSLSHKPNAWNIENRPALGPYFPSNYGKDGDILRIWNNPSKIPAGQIPSVEITFDLEVALYQLGLEGYRQDDAWKVQAYDAQGNLVTPNWLNPNQLTHTKPGGALGNTAINLLTTEGALGAETLSTAEYRSDDHAFYVWNKDNVFQRGASVLDYNGAVVKKIVYSMIELNTTSGKPTGDPADQSMYIGSGLIFTQVPEPSSVTLLGLGGLVLLLRRAR